MLNVVIGLVLIFLLYSLFATTVLELVSSILAFRGRNLEKALRNMLDGGGDQLFREFKENPMYQQLSGKFIGKNTPPSYLSSEKFRSILFQILDKDQTEEEIASRIEKLPDGGLKPVLRQILNDAQQDKEAFKQKVELWFDDVMDRASGWYKRHIQKVLIFLGLGIAVSFNVDSLQIYAQLSRDPDAANRVALEAARVVAGRENLEAEEPQALREEVYDLLAQNLEVLKSPLGIGWDAVPMAKMDWVDWLLKAFGWFVTALAISLGAPFWFDLLKKAVNIRSSGKAIDGK
jgi:hypothetical protein